MGCDELNMCCPHKVPYITPFVNHCFTKSVCPSLWREAKNTKELKFARIQISVQLVFYQYYQRF